MKVHKLLRLLFVFVFVSCALAVFADDEVPGETIKGKITTSDGKPAPYVSVTVEKLNKGAVTNEEGEYIIKKVPVGTWVIKISSVGINSEERTISLHENETINADFQIEENAQQLQEVVVNTALKNKKTSPSLRISEPLIEAPQNIQVVSSDLLNSQIITNMADGVFKNVSGMTRLEHWADLYTRINTRGWRATSLRNGMNITGDWGPLSEDMGFVDRVEFVKGPAGFLMSVGDPGGTYNVVTKKPTGKDFNGSANFTYGSFDFYRATVDLDGKLNKSGTLLYRLNLVGQNKNSFRKYEYNDRYVVAPTLTYKIDDKTSLTAEYVYQKAKMSDVGADYSFSPKGFATLPRDFTALDPGLDPTNINDQSITLSFQRQLNDHWKFTAQAAYFYYRQKGGNLWPDSLDADGNMLRQVGIWDAKSVNQFGQAYFNGDLNTGAVHHRILIGLDAMDKKYMADWDQYHNLDSPDHLFNPYSSEYQPPTNGYADFDFTTPLKERAGQSVYNEYYTGLYLQDELGFFDNKLRLTLAARYTYAKMNSYGTLIEGKRVTPRIGLGYSFTDNFTAYALFDQSFNPQQGVMKSGGGVPPVLGSNLEAGLKKNWNNGRFTTSLSVYRIIRNHVTAGDPTDPNSIYVVDIGKTKSQGIEFDAMGEVFKGMTAVVNYALTDSKVTEANPGDGQPQVGDKVAGYAKHNINTWLSYKIQNGVLKGFGLSGGFSFLADRTTWSWSNDPSLQKLPSYFRLDGGVNYQTGKLNFALNVYNIIDKYLYSGDVGFWTIGNAEDKPIYSWQTEPPRNFKFSVTYNF